MCGGVYTKAHAALPGARHQLRHRDNDPYDQQGETDTGYGKPDKEDGAVQKRNIVAHHRMIGTGKRGYGKNDHADGRYRPGDRPQRQKPVSGIHVPQRPCHGQEPEDIGEDDMNNQGDMEKIIAGHDILDQRCACHRQQRGIQAGNEQGGHAQLQPVARLSAATLACGIKSVIVLFKHT